MVPSARLLVLSLITTCASLVGTVAATAVPAAPAVPPAAAPSSVVAPAVVAPSPVRAVVVRPRAVHVRATPAPTPRATRAPQPRPRATSSPAPAVRRTTSRALTPQQLMQQAIDRLPGFHTGDAVFAITPGLDHWGLAELHSGVIYISPDVPSNRMYDVVAHEWSHVLSAKAYGSDVNATMAALNAYFGGSGLVGSERAADCMARLLGASWTHYTSCSDSHWRDGARQLLARQQV